MSARLRQSAEMEMTRIAWLACGISATVLGACVLTLAPAAPHPARGPSAASDFVSASFKFRDPHPEDIYLLYPNGSSREVAATCRATPGGSARSGTQWPEYVANSCPSGDVVLWSGPNDSGSCLVIGPGITSGGLQRDWASWAYAPSYSC